MPDIFYVGLKGTEWNALLLSVLRNAAVPDDRRTDSADHGLSQHLPGNDPAEVGSRSGQGSASRLASRIYFSLYRGGYLSMVSLPGDYPIPGEGRAGGAGSGIRQDD